MLIILANFVGTNFSGVEISYSSANVLFEYKLSNDKIVKVLPNCTSSSNIKLGTVKESKFSNLTTNLSS